MKDLDQPVCDNQTNEATALACGSLLLDTYRIRTDAVRGSRLEVWRVCHTGWNADLAMKRPLPDILADKQARADFVSGCRQWMALAPHPNLIPCYYVREIAGSPALFTEWMENGSLEMCIREETLYEGNDAEQQARLLDVAIQTARGLAAIHQNGMVHGRVQPGNLLLTDSWQAKIDDIGLAGLYGGESSGYCAQEQLDGMPPTVHADIYGWAVCVMEMFLGMHCSQDERLTADSCRRFFGVCRVEVPDELQTLLAQCLETDPEKRPRDFGVICDELEKLYLDATGKPYFRPAAKMGFVSSGALNNRALAELDTGSTDEAEETLRTALRVNPADNDAEANLLLLRWRRGELDAGELGSQLLPLLRKEEKAGFERALAAEKDALSLAGTHEDSQFITEIACTLDGTRLAIADFSDLKVVPFDKEKPLFETTVSEILGLCFSRDGQTLYIHRTGSVLVLDAVTGERKESVAIPTYGKPTLQENNLRLSQDGTKLALLYSRQGGTSCWMFVIDTATAQAVADFKLPYQFAKELCLMPSGEEALVLSSGGDNCCLRCSLKNGETIREYPLNLPADDDDDDDWPCYTGLCVSHDGSFFVTCTDSGNAQVWDMADGHLQKEFPVISDRLTSLLLLPGDDTLVLGDCDGVVHTFSLSGSEPRRRFEHGQWVKAFAPLTDGTFMVFGHCHLTHRLRLTHRGASVPMRYSRSLVFTEPPESPAPAEEETDMEEEEIARADEPFEEEQDSEAREPKKKPARFSWRGLFGKKR